MTETLGALTTRGRAFLASGITAAICSMVLGQKDLLRVGVLLTALPLITALIMSRARYRIICSREVQPRRVPTGSPVTVTLRLQNAGRMPTGVLLLEDQVPYVLGTRPRFVVDQMGPRWRREVAYTVRSDVRGRYELGPMAVRVSDQFGLVELTRSFPVTSLLTVTPQALPLPSSGVNGEWSGTGDNRPRAFAAAGTEDVTIREYREGDDLRRVHWPSTARSGELMVRREEQPWQSRCTVFLDTRKIAHRGSGPASSFEWAITATASAGVHLAHRGFALRLGTDVTSATGGQGWHDRGAGWQGETDSLLDMLAVARPSDRTRLDIRSMPDQGHPGLVVAIVGLLEPEDVLSLGRLRRGNAAGFAILLDAGAWTRERASADKNLALRTRNAATALRRQGWQVAVATTGTSIADVWGSLTRRPEKRAS